MKALNRSLGLFVFGLSPLFAQAGVNLVAADYSAPASFEVAPGQVVTLFFRGVKPLADGALRSGQANSDTLPTTLAGLAGRLSQGSQTLQIPIFSVRQENQCGDSQAVNPACVLTSLRVQIPFELALVPEPPSSEGLPSAAPLASLVLEVDGQASSPFPLQPVAVNSHVLTTCDVNTDARPPAACDRMAFHSDGQKVNAASPAKRGETILVYAFGLGPVSPTAATGKPAQPGAEIHQSGVLRVWTTLRNQPINASASVSRFFDANAMSNPGSGLEFAGLAPGFIGLYQLNIRIPSTFEPILPCGGEIRSNALVLVTTRQGSEVVPLCVQP